MAQTADDDRPWWSVHAQAVGDVQYDEDLLEAFLDNLLEHDGVVTGTPEEPIDGRARYGARFSVRPWMPWKRSPGRAKSSTALPRRRAPAMAARTGRGAEGAGAGTGPGPPRLPGPARRGRAGRAVEGLAPAGMDGDRAARLPPAGGSAQGDPRVDGGQRAPVP
jgi:hypothetical protein